jgi:hypothetical protein
MSKSQNKELHKQKDPMDDKNYKDKKALVGQVRKVVKKSQRKLGEEKFDKELQRTIGFLTELRDKLSKTATNSSHKTAAAKAQPKAPAKPSATVATKVAAKAAAKAPAKVPAKPAAKVSAAAPVSAKTANKKA